MQTSKHPLVNLLFVSIFSLVLSSCIVENAAETIIQPAPLTVTAPTNVQATAGSEQNTLSWTAVTGADSYNIYQSERTIDDISDVGPSVNVTTTTEIITGLTNGTEYHYVVTAKKGDTESTKSTEVATTPVLLATFTESYGSIDFVKYPKAVLLWVMRVHMSTRLKLVVMSKMNFPSTASPLLMIFT